MLITAVRASWLRALIPADRAHVSDFGTNDSFNMCLVEVETDTGLVGLGEAKAAVGNLGNYAAIVALIREELAPPLIGRDPRDITAIWELCYNGSRAHYATREGRTFPTIGRRGITLSAISGIDIALWDLLGQSLGVPVWRLLGGRYRERVPAYASGGWAPVGGIGTQLAQYVERGHRAVKLRVGLQDKSVSDSAARVREVRETLGPDVGIMVDAHGTWSVREAQRFARKVEGDDLAWLEEPVSPDNLEGQAEVRRSTDIPIAAGESEQTRFAFREMIDARRGGHLPARSRDRRRHHRDAAHLRAGRGERAHGGAASVGLGHSLRGRAAPDDLHSVRHARRVLARAQPAPERSRGGAGRARGRLRARALAARARADLPARFREVRSRWRCSVVRRRRLSPTYRRPGPGVEGDAWLRIGPRDDRAVA